MFTHIGYMIGTTRLMPDYINAADAKGLRHREGMTQAKNWVENKEAK
ncbi:hypothetical protein L4D09_18835 [Photobacterium makurazakiensis]